jgi:DNA repair protein RecN (Recombination protein N)
MLAIKAVQGNHSPVPTIILDEIDTGVSGHVAECMAKMMREMARGQQVISVTHLPQVAGAADHHLRVSKHTTSDRVNTVVTPLSLSDRVEELASMLSGARITDAAREHAQSLLAEGK